MIEVMINGILDSVSMHPQVSLFFSLLGTLLCVSTVIDAMIPDEIDGGFSKKIMDLPFIGVVLKSIMRFSVLRNKK